MGIHTATLAGNVSGPYDWEADDERRRRRGDDEHWYRQADNTPLMAGQFWALWNAHKAEFNQLREKVNSVEDRLVEERAKHLAIDVASSGIAKISAIILAIITALILTDVIHLHNPFG